MSFTLSFSDSGSYFDLGAGSTFFNGAAGGNALSSVPFFQLYQNMLAGAATGHYSATGSDARATSAASFDARGGKMSGALTVDPLPRFDQGIYNAFAVVAFSGEIVLAPGDSVKFDATYKLKGLASNDVRPSYASATAFAIFRPDSDPNTQLYNGYSYGDTGVFGMLPRSGSWTTSISNHSSLPTRIRMSFATAAEAWVGPVTVRPVPEPQSWALFVGGLAALAARARRPAGSGKVA